MIIKVPIEISQTGEGLKATVAGLQEVDKQAGKARKSATDLTGAIKGWASGVASVAAVTAAAKAFGDAILRASEHAEALSNASAKTGLHVEALQRLERVAKNAGLSLDTMTRAVNIMQRNITGNTTELKKYGIEVEKLGAMTPEEQFRELAKQITAMESPTQRAAAAMAAFGRSGAELLPVMEQIARQSSELQVSLSQDQVEALLKVDAAVDDVSGAWGDLVEQLAATAAATPGAVAGANDLAEAISLIAQTIKENQPAFQLYFDLVGRMAGLTGANSPLGALRLLGVVAGRGPKPGGGGFGMEAPELDFGDPMKLMKQMEQEQAGLKAQLDTTAKRLEKERETLDVKKQIADAERKISLELEQQRRIQAEMAGPLASQIQGVQLLKTRGGFAGAAPTVPGATKFDIGDWSKFDNQLTKTNQTVAETVDQTSVWAGELNTLATQLSNLAQVTGGFTGKLVGMLSAMSSGAGGILSGISGWKSAGGGLTGFLGKLSSGLGIVGSAVGLVGGLVGGIKSLFGGKSKEEKAAEEAAKRQREEERKAAIEEAKRLKIEGLKSAQAAAEALMDRMAKGGLGEGLTASLGTLIGKVQEALLKSGLGYMATPGLRESEAFMGAQGMAGEVAQLLAGMRAGGALDSGLLAAAGASAAEIRAQAQAAAEEAGMAPADAVKAGFGAIAPLLREQLNAAMASGQELDENTKALIEEARKNGIEIIADPMVESVSVQKDMLKELRSMNDRGGGSPDRSFASGTFGLRVVKRDMLASIHEGEGFMVIPRDKMGRGVFGSFARGTEEPDREGGGGGRIPGPGGPGLPSPAPSSGGGTAGEVVAEVRRLAREVRRRPTEAVTQVFQPTFKLDPLQTVESREELSKTLTDQFLRDLRNNPTVQYAVQRAARTR